MKGTSKDVTILRVTSFSSHASQQLSRWKLPGTEHDPLWYICWFSQNSKFEGNVWLGMPLDYPLIGRLSGAHQTDASEVAPKFFHLMWFSLQKNACCLNFPEMFSLPPTVDSSANWPQLVPRLRVVTPSGWMRAYTLNLRLKTLHKPKDAGG